MIVYLDTSAFLKLYLQASESARIQRLVANAASVCTHLVTYTEMRASLARAARMERLTEADLRAHTRTLAADWLTLELVGVDEPLVRRAGDCAQRYGLRGYDSVQLAAAERAFDGGGRPPHFLFAAFDKELCVAARALGLAVLP